jgi:glycosyltransferase involved in cell wall biosynthesis
MPTGGRAEFALQAVRYFQRQDRFERELIIVDDGLDDLGERLPSDPRIVYLCAPRGESIGAKRNLACEHASGEFIAQWDDDDWYGANRLSVQLAPLLDGKADMTGLGATIFFNVREWRFWRPGREMHSALFDDDVAGGTLIFRREVWEQLARYPDLSLEEDAWFQREAIERGARLECVTCDPPVFMYVRHGGNAWTDLSADGGEGYIEIDEPVLCEEDRRFYRSRQLSEPCARADSFPIGPESMEPLPPDFSLAEHSFMLAGRDYSYFVGDGEDGGPSTNERAVEIALVSEEIERFGRLQAVIEVGNVLGHHLPIGHRVISAEDEEHHPTATWKEDLVEFQPPFAPELVVSISALGRVGHPFEPQRFTMAVENIVRWLKPGGRLLFTVPMGYNPGVRAYLDAAHSYPITVHCMRRATIGNLWVQASYEEVRNVPYGRPFPCANAIAIVEARRS